jgi:hypothetical protein
MYFIVKENRRGNWATGRTSKQCAVLKLFNNVKESQHVLAKNIFFLYKCSLSPSRLLQTENSFLRLSKSQEKHRNSNFRLTWQLPLPHWFSITKIPRSCVPGFLGRRGHGLSRPHVQVLCPTGVIMLVWAVLWAALTSCCRHSSIQNTCLPDTWTSVTWILISRSWQKRKLLH